MFPFLLSSNENENHNENDSHFGPLRGPPGRHHFNTPLSHSGAGTRLKKFQFDTLARGFAPRENDYHSHLKSIVQGGFFLLRFFQKITFS